MVGADGGLEMVEGIGMLTNCYILKWSLISYNLT